MKPSWDDAPKWANYLAMDENGTWIWYAAEPFVEGDGWVNQKANSFEEAKIAGWKESLEERPE